MLYNQTAVSAEEYVGRLFVSEKKVTLHAVRMRDEGSFTVLDREGKVRRRNCLNVRGEPGSLRLSACLLCAFRSYVQCESFLFKRDCSTQNQTALIVPVVLFMMHLIVVVWVAKFGRISEQFHVGTASLLPRRRKCGSAHARDSAGRKH